jgi:transcriptional regulator with XRE-family HTH domain
MGRRDGILIGANISEEAHLNTDEARRYRKVGEKFAKYEKGVNRIGIGRLVRVAKILNVPLTALLDEANDARPSIPQSPLHLIADSMPLRLAQAFSAIDDPAIRRVLVALVEKAAGPRSRPRRRGRRKPA